jgi:platelet-activating factor acetylhydrolase
VGTSHPSVTDAPLIEPWLLSFTTGATIDVHEGVNQYVKVTQKFLQYQNTGVKEGILAECVTHPEYRVEDESRPDSGNLPDLFQKYWQIHVAPCGPEVGEE